MTKIGQKTGMSKNGMKVRTSDSSTAFTSDHLRYGPAVGGAATRISYSTVRQDSRHRQPSTPAPLA
jgi:hypothetical protein